MTRLLIAIPALNEEKVLRGSIETLRRFAHGSLADLDTSFIIADNGSDDSTAAIGRELAASFSDVSYVRVVERGKGGAIRAAWTSADADVYAFTDADLATDIVALPELLRRIRNGAAIAVGSRYADGSRVRRSAFRKSLSFGYRSLLRIALGTRVADLPCGFKAATSEAVRTMLPRVKNDRWFFDTEFVVRAERAGFRIDEVPVTWRELRPQGRRSKVRIAKLVVEYVREVLRLRGDLAKNR